MAKKVIDLRKLKNELKGNITPETELAPPAEEKLLETEAAAHPEGFDEGDVPSPALVEWQAFEFELNADQSLMRFIAGAILVLGGAAVLFFKNFLFALVLAISGGLVIAYAFQIPRALRFAVTPRGVIAGTRRYEFADLKSFWIAYDPPLFKELVLESRKALMPLVRIPLGDLDPVRLREILLRFLREEKKDASVIDIVSKRLGF